MMPSEVALESDMCQGETARNNDALSGMKALVRCGFGSSSRVR